MVNPAIVRSFAFNFADLYIENSPNITEDTTISVAVPPSKNPSQ
jgi:hypothetical protein